MLRRRSRRGPRLGRGVTGWATGWGGYAGPCGRRDSTRDRCHRAINPIRNPNPTVRRNLLRARRRLWQKDTPKQLERENHSDAARTCVRIVKDYWDPLLAI